MLAAPFVDPFVQLVLTFPSRSTLEPAGQALIHTARLYDPNQYVPNSRNTAASGTYCKASRSG